MSYGPQHASALALLARKGATMTFTRKVKGAMTMATGLHAADTTSTVVGKGVRVQGDPDEYSGSSLKIDKDPTFFFVPTTRGQLPIPGDTVPAASVTYTVARVFPLNPDSAGAIAARVVCTV